MNERGFGLVDAIVATAVMAVVALAASGMLVALPPAVARWDDNADARQRLRVLDARVAELTSRASPIVTRVDDVVVRVPSLWPRRLGFWSPDDPDVVSSTSLTIVSRVDAHRELTTLDPVGAAGGAVRMMPGAGCGTAPRCALAEGDVVLVIARDNACALFRIADARDPLVVAALMPADTPSFDAGAVAIPVSATVIAFERASSEVRVYDAYRSDNVLMDGVASIEFALVPEGTVSFDPDEYGGAFLDTDGARRDTGALGDGPFVGRGAMAFDVDQLRFGGVTVSLALTGTPGRAPYAAALEWRIPPWPWPPPSS